MTEQTPMLSVVIPFHENQRTFTASLSSFCTQSVEGEQYEIIVVNDWSRRAYACSIGVRPLPGTIIPPVYGHLWPARQNELIDQIEGLEARIKARPEYQSHLGPKLDKFYEAICDVALIKALVQDRPRLRSMMDKLHRKLESRGPAEYNR